MLVVDIETTGLNPHTDRIIGIGINDLYEHELDWAAHLLRGQRITCHNGSFDIKFLWAAGIDVTLEFDTMLAAYVLPVKPDSLSLGSCAEFYLKESADWKQTLKKTSASELDYQTLREYCLKDVEITKRLRVVLERLLIQNNLMDFYKKLIRARNTLSRAEFLGINVDWQRLNELTARLENESNAIKKVLTIEEEALINTWQRKQLHEKASKLKTEKGKQKVLSGPAPEFNWSSPSQVLYALKEIGANTSRYDFKEKTSKESSSSEVLEDNAHLGRFIPGVLQLRSAEKTLGILEGYKELKNANTNKIHANLNLSVTATGRLSSSNPNLQNVDKGPTVRSLFIPSPGKVFVIADLAQIEVRFAAHYSQDEKLLEMFRNGEDFYGKIAVEVLKTPCLPNEVKEKFPEDRAVAKVIGLSILYGTGVKRLQAAIKRGAGRDYSELECRNIISNYFQQFSGLKSLQKRVESVLLSKGYITNMFGRRLYIPPEGIFMNGVNYLLQSSASDLMLFRQLEFNSNSDLIMLIHDECIRETTPELAPLVKAEMETILQQVDDIKFRVPLKADAKICLNWSEGK